MKSIIGYKLLKLRRNGTLGSLFINCRAVIPKGIWLKAENHPTKGYAKRPGWHVCEWEWAPHLSMKGRVWRRVEITNYKHLKRPLSQGGMWYLAQRMKVCA